MSVLMIMLDHDTSMNGSRRATRHFSGQGRFRETRATSINILLKTQEKKVPQGKFLESTRAFFPKSGTFFDFQEMAGRAFPPPH